MKGKIFFCLVIILCLIFWVYDGENNEQTEDSPTVSMDFLEEENMGYDLAISYTQGRTIVVYTLFDFDRQVITSMQAHYHFDGEHYKTDHISTGSIAGDLESGWYTNPEDDNHTYYSYSQEDGKGIITQDFNGKPYKTYREGSVKYAVEFLKDGLEGMSSSAVITALTP